MKKLLSLLIVTLSANVIANEQWPPANEPPERAAIFLEKTYQKPENVKVGVTLFISGWNKQKQTWNEPYKYGKIEAIAKNKKVDGKKCDAFTIDPDKKSPWYCLERLLNEPKPYKDQYGEVYNAYYTRFDDPALNGGKPFKPAESKDEFDDFVSTDSADKEKATSTSNPLLKCDDERFNPHIKAFFEQNNNKETQFVSLSKTKELALDTQRNLRVCAGKLEMKKSEPIEVIYLIQLLPDGKYTMSIFKII
ncbi:hypothetical protein [Actinobacillus porcinus]|uniref:hypothetical protein n=1 Tax=Actinobacillus porcinus TaxID=51048 RepID=UPI002A915270|nr:hypothetical protein [Actinobacillus porcinus]MDY6216943.1 hypothetical protein [Actinobacillus porcinus]